MPRTRELMRAGSKSHLATWSYIISTLLDRLSVHQDLKRLPLEVIHDSRKNVGYHHHIRTGLLQANPTLPDKLDTNVTRALNGFWLWVETEYMKLWSDLTNLCSSQDPVWVVLPKNAPVEKLMIDPVALRSGYPGEKCFRWKLSQSDIKKSIHFLLLDSGVDSGLWSLESDDRRREAAVWLETSESGHCDCDQWWQELLALQEYCSFAGYKRTSSQFQIWSRRG